MQKLVVLVAVFGWVGCKGDTRPERKLVPGTNRIAESEHAPTPVAAPKVDPACAAKLEDFSVWMTALEEEKAAYEIEMFNHLATIDRAPAPVEREMDTVALTPKQAQGWDASEANHVGGDLGKTDAAIVENLTKMHGMTNDHPDRIRVDIDEGTPWSEAVRVIGAIQKAGYKEALFAFNATSKVTPPPGVEPWTTTAEAHDAATAKLKELKKGCKDWDEGIIIGTKDLVAALEKCNCAVDLDEVRVQTFKETRWHQAHPHVGVLVQLGDGTAVTASPKATWGATAKQVVDASAAGAQVKLAAK
jgi:hypothetical protein